jgi:hypothetical protein
MSSARDSFIHEVKQRPFVVVLADDDIVDELRRIAVRQEVAGEL